MTSWPNLVVSNLVVGDAPEQLSRGMFRPFRSHRRLLG